MMTKSEGEKDGEKGWTRNSFLLHLGLSNPIITLDVAWAFVSISPEREGNV